MSAGKRKNGESFKDYRARLWHEAKHIKVRLQGRWFWRSDKFGTYRRERP